MYYRYPDRPFGANAPTFLHESLPPPAAAPSATSFVTRVVLIAIGLFAVIALIATASPAVIIPLGSIFLTYLAAALVLTRRERREQRAQRRMLRPHRVADGRDVSPARLGILVAVSLGLLGAGFLFAEGIGALLAAIGFAGLLIARILASADGWAPW